MENFDAYFKKIVHYNYRNHNLQFHVSQDLFSSYGIDIGTQRLLRTLTAKEFNNSNKILDLGCGYGPIGIALKVAFQLPVVHMVDRDALALKYSRQNVELNNLSNIEIYASLGYDDVKAKDFDLIVSNIPAKVGKPALSHLLRDARFYLRPKGKVVVVVIDDIAKYVTRVLSDPNINILFHKSWRGHVFYRYEFSSRASPASQPRLKAFERRIYDRGKKIISIGSVKIPIQTVYGLLEFDTLSYETGLILDSLSILQDQHIDRTAIFNPGQGFIPVALSQSNQVGEIVLIDRNLLALRVSRRNLELNGYPAKKIFLSHQVGIYQNRPGTINCVIGILEEKDGPAVHKMLVHQAVSELAPEGLIILSSSSTVITRVESFIHAKKFLNVFKRQRNKGKSVIICKLKSKLNNVAYID